jgi:SAM-dependent methyltransferase
VKHSALLEPYLDDLSQACDEFPVLDLACGGGRNGLFLAQRGIPVVFADIREEALQQVAAQQAIETTNLWQVDLEPAEGNPLADRQFSAIMVFRYLHRPLLPAIKAATRPGGLVIYETFTVEQPKFGRPHNPDFLLKPGELQQCFGDWQILHSLEGTVSNNDTEQAIARIVARKPGMRAGDGYDR